MRKRLILVALTLAIAMQPAGAATGLRKVVRKALYPARVFARAAGYVIGTVETAADDGYYEAAKDNRNAREASGKVLK